MRVYRIGKKKFAKDLAGEGARLNGGRWNHPGISCIYTGGTRAIALVEYTAHVSEDNIPRALCFTCFEVPENSIQEIKIEDLPGNWREWPHPVATREFGSAMLSRVKHLLIRIPSVIIPEEFNYLINPLHPDIKKVKIVSVTDHIYDLRLKQDHG